MFYCALMLLLHIAGIFSIFVLELFNIIKIINLKINEKVIGKEGGWGRAKEARERRGRGEKRKDMRILTKLEIDHFSFAKESDMIRKLVTFTEYNLMKEGRMDGQFE